MTCQTPFNEQLAHLKWMASIPGAKHYAWHLAKELAEDRSGLWPEIDKVLAAEMKAAGLSESRENTGG